MADLNNLLQNVQKQSKNVEKSLRELLGNYENLYREGHKSYISERSASRSNSGLEDFQRLVHIIKRNRDIVGSLLRGISNMRKMDNFSFVEEDIPEINENELKKLKVPAGSEPQGEING